MTQTFETSFDLQLRRRMRLVRPGSADQLHSYVRSVLGFRMPRAPVVSGHAAPFDYLLHTFFEDGRDRDCIVWANRGGGKTQIAAIATLLDLLFKPGIQIRILGGSFDQSSKMYGYLKRILETDVFSDLTAGSLTGRFVELTNGSRVEVLSQSERAVRGQRVHKLRCDEVELFEPDVWEAAQLVTRSGRCGDVFVRAGIETLSTMHRPYGLMSRLVREAESHNRKIFRWNLLDTLQHCDSSRMCGNGIPANPPQSAPLEPGESPRVPALCPLWDECQGRAKAFSVRGFFDIDDAIIQKSRVGLQTWKSEMLCETPSLADSVYPEFNPKLHVFGEPRDPHVELGMHDELFIGGIDFGFRAPTALLLAVIDRDGVIHIMDELVERGRTTEQFIAMANDRCARHRMPRPEWLGADPAGHQRSEHTGVSTITLWRRAGWNIRTRVLPIEAGIAAVRRKLLRADGGIGLRIHARCATLIESLAKYHYAPDRPEITTPLKDGNDHAADALRYMITNLDNQSRVRRSRY